MNPFPFETLLQQNLIAFKNKKDNSLIFSHPAKYTIL